MVVGAQSGKPFVNPISITAKGELSSRNIDLNAEAELEFFNGSKALISSAINKTMKNSVLIFDEEKSLFISEPWQCGEQNNRQSNIIFKKEGKEDRVIEFKETKGVFTHEIDHFVDLINKKETQ